MSVLELVETSVTTSTLNATTASQAKPPAKAFSEADKLVDHVIEVVG